MLTVMVAEWSQIIDACVKLVCLICRVLNSILGFTRIFRIMVSQKKVCRLLSDVTFRFQRTRRSCLKL